MKIIILKLFFRLFLKKIVFIQKIKCAAFKANYFPKNTSFFDHDIDIKNPKNIKIGDNCIVGKCTLGAQSKIEIGNKVTISKGVIIETGGLMNSVERKHISKPIRIGDYAWLGNNVIVLGGVNIGDGAFIGSGSIIRKDVKPYTIVIDNKIIGTRLGFNNKNHE